MIIQDAIKSLINKEDLTLETAIAVFTEIMSGNATDSQIAAFLIALRMKGESIDEIMGAATVMREKATFIELSTSQRIIDTCGTGGDGSNTFNISTAAAFVAAGAGAVVAKHGNRSVSSKCGSADVLEALGVNVSVTPETMKKCLDEIGIGFLFAPSLHKAMKYAIGPRKEIGVRTIFNILGPLTNPARAHAQLLGVFSPSLTSTMAQVLQRMGSIKAYVVHGLDNLDEISLSAPTQITEVNQSSLNTFEITPEEFGFKRVPINVLVGGTPDENASTIKKVLSGEKGPSRDAVVLNAAFAIAAAGIVATPQDGVRIAEESIDSRTALNKLETLAKLTNS